MRKGVKKREQKRKGRKGWENPPRKGGPKEKGGENPPRKGGENINFFV